MMLAVTFIYLPQVGKFAKAFPVNLPEGLTIGFRTSNKLSPLILKAVHALENARFVHVNHSSSVSVFHSHSTWLAVSIRANSLK